MSTTQPRFVILAAVDFTDFAERVIQTAANIASTSANAEVHLVHVAGSSLQRDSERLAQLAQVARRTHRGPLYLHLTVGTAWRGIVQTATSLDADLVLVGTRDLKGIERLADGSVSQRVAKHVGCPVMLVRAKAHHGDKSIEIDPPCADCVNAQKTTNGKTMFCARHTTHHAQGHTFYEYPQTFADGANILRP